MKKNLNQNRVWTGGLIPAVIQGAKQELIPVRTQALGVCSCLLLILTPAAAARLAVEYPEPPPGAAAAEFRPYFTGGRRTRRQE